MVAPVQASSGNSLWVMEVTRPAPPNPLVKKVPNTSGHGFATVSPDDATVAAAWGGKLWTFDRRDRRKDRRRGAREQDDGHASGLVARREPARLRHRSRRRPFGRGTRDDPVGERQVGRSDGHRPVDRDDEIFPMHSPDGRWIAFSRGKGGHGDLSSQLFIVPAKGGAPVELQNANRMVSNQLGDGQTENNQPTWAPPGDLHWIAFNSQREYGVVLPKGTQQIWVAAVDPEKLARGEDPSYPAFRLQFQGLRRTITARSGRSTFEIRPPGRMPVRPVRTRQIPPPPPEDAGASPPADAMASPVPDAEEPPPPPPPACRFPNQTCDPVSDTCCGTGYRCDSHDDGETYKCYPPVVVIN